MHFEKKSNDVSYNVPKVAFVLDNVFKEFFVALLFALKLLNVINEMTLTLFMYFLNQHYQFGLLRLDEFLYYLLYCKFGTFSFPIFM